MYTNNEADKKKRHRNYTLFVFILPTVVELLGLSMLYLMDEYFNLTKAEKTFFNLLTICTVFAIFGFNQNKWVKMPDGTYYFKVGQPNKLNFYTPDESEISFYYLKRSKWFVLIAGIVFAGLSILLYHTHKSLILFIGMVPLWGLFMYIGIIGLINNKAQLKLSQAGLWTKKLGFVSWDNVKNARVVEVVTGNENYNLEIYLYETIFSQTNQPDETFGLSDIKGGQYVEMIIENFYHKRNEKEISH